MKFKFKNFRTNLGSVSGLILIIYVQRNTSSGLFQVSIDNFGNGCTVLCDELDLLVTLTLEFSLAL